MLETLRGYGAGLLAGAGEQGQAQAALARYAVRVAEEAGAGMLTTAGEAAAARRLDAEDAMMGPVLAWAVEHDLAVAARLVSALGDWWVLRGRLAGQEPLLRELAGRAGPGSDGWCAAQARLAWIAFDAADLPQALQRCAAIIDVLGARQPSPLLVDCLGLQSSILANLGRVPESAASSRRALALARELGYRAGQVRATMGLVTGALVTGHLDEAAQLARQSMQIPDIPGANLRGLGYLLAGALAETGDLPAAEQACAATLAQARDAGDLITLGDLLRIMADLDLQAGRTGDAAPHLREAAQLSLQTGAWLMTLNVLEGCGHLCAATGRPADAVTVWAASDTFSQQGGIEDLDTDPWVRRGQEARRNAREALGPDRARAAEQRGAAMSPATAAEYALLLTAPDPPPPAGTAAPGRLSPRKQELVTLVAEGRTDAQIAAQLYISIRTVRSHLDRIRDKTGCRRRADLTRLALAEGLV
jgi:DNA-binding CsgD family transcriptional regulator